MARADGRHDDNTILNTLPDTDTALARSATVPQTLGSAGHAVHAHAVHAHAVHKGFPLTRMNLKPIVA